MMSAVMVNIQRANCRLPSLPSSIYLNESADAVERSVFLKSSNPVKGIGLGSNEVERSATGERQLERILFPVYIKTVALLFESIMYLIKLVFSFLKH